MEPFLQLKVRIPWKLHVKVHYARECAQPSIMKCTDMAFRHNKAGDLLASSNCSILRDTKDFTEVLPCAVRHATESLSFSVGTF